MSKAFNKFELIFKGLSSISPNEIFTPRDVAIKVIDNLRYTEEDWLQTVIDTRQNESSPVKFIDLGCKTGIFLDEIYDRIYTSIQNSSFSETKKQDLIYVLKNNMLFAVPTSSQTFLSIRKLFQANNLNIENIIGSKEIFENAGADYPGFAYDVIKLANMVLSKSLHENVMLRDVFGNKEKYANALKNKKDSKDFSQHFEKIANIANINDDMVWSLVEKLTEIKFKVAVGNPPYQDSNIAKNQAPPIYQDFFDTGLLIAQEVSMIFKDNWARAMFDENNGLHKWRKKIFQDDRVKSVDFTGKVFTADVTTSIIYASVDTKDNAFFVDKEKSKRPKNGYPIFKSSESKIIAKTTMNHSIEEIKLDFRDYSLNRTKLREEKTKNKGTVEVKSFVGRERVFTRADKSVLKKEWEHLLEKGYKLGYADIRPWQQNEKSWIYDLGKNQIAGEGFSMIVFNSLKERNNYKKYINTKLWLYLCKISKVNTEDRNGKLYFIPDLEDYTDDNPLFSSDNKLPSDHPYIGKSLNERLYEFFEFSDDEIKTIENSVI